MTAPEVTISNAFDGGNGVLVKTEEAIENGVTNVEVKIQPDIYTELEKKQHFQHFYFRALVKGCGTVRYSIVNAGEASYAKAWKDSTTFVCTTTPSDAHSWKRVLDTKYEDGHLTWTQTHERSGSAYFAYFAYFPPYSYERHLQFIAKCEASPDCTVESLGQTLDGRELDCISVGSGSSVCWIIHRQHPGESMAEYYAEGLLTRLLGLDRNGAVDGQVRNVLQKYKFYIVPNMCPDGAIRGHLRTNACGANLNREWTSTGNDGDDDYYQAPTLERSPEVYHVLKKMDETSVDAFLDVHGDEALPFNFLAGSEGCTNWSTRLEALHGAFLASYERSNSDMQREISYEPDAPNEGMPNICSNQIALRYDCFSATLEQPFKDCLTNPDPTRGWNPARSAQLGASVVDALAYVHPYLRDETEFWKNLPEEDKYIRPTNKY
eukprot:CAMPEP_0178932656 /NCGR_PEP_ID=MMETSP0786-20121207/22759_1 /TAXON_ID=186022 /ORGANISM="Thalassionema frauenfeldii, Strain CCMP 1798" /LENGTH=435 /DNA_ID=CAMNT_0020610013 /DNA_START=257 /DNA_END=1564 /DNA_ORIENTATION=-